MTLLLDTHTVLWFWWDAPLLSAAAKALICDPAHRKLVSFATVWEVAIKVSLNPAGAPHSPRTGQKQYNASAKTLRISAK